MAATLTGEREPEPDPVYVCEGWWHPNCVGGKVHDHPDHPDDAPRGWSIAIHRLCERVYTRRSR